VWQRGGGKASINWTRRKERENLSTYIILEKKERETENSGEDPEGGGLIMRKMASTRRECKSLGEKLITIRKG